MAEQTSRLSAPLRLILRLLLTVALVWGLSTGLERLFFVDGGFPAYIIIGSLLTLMNVIVRPLLHVILLPFKLFMSFFALIIANALFLWLTQIIAAKLDPTVVTMAVDGGVGGWIVVALIFGIANWIFKEILR